MIGSHDTIYDRFYCSIPKPLMIESICDCATFYHIFFLSLPLKLKNKQYERTKKVFVVVSVKLGFSQSRKTIVRRMFVFYWLNKLIRSLFCHLFICQNNERGESKMTDDIPSWKRMKIWMYFLYSLSLSVSVVVLCHSLFGISLNKLKYKSAHKWIGAEK